MEILLVEDDIINQRITQQVLTKWGANVTTVPDGLDALQLLSNRVFDLILMDVNLPSLGGIETTRIVRGSQNPAVSMIPIFAFTASPDADTTEKAQKLGMNDCLSKPLNAVEILTKMNQHVLFPTVESKDIKIKYDIFQEVDSSFQLELLNLMIRNLKELQHACYRSFYNNDYRTFETACHKVKSTLILIDDEELFKSVDELKLYFKQCESLELANHIRTFTTLVEGIIKSIWKEMSGLQPASI